MGLFGNKTHELVQRLTAELADRDEQIKLLQADIKLHVELVRGLQRDVGRLTKEMERMKSFCEEEHRRHQSIVEGIKALLG